MLGCSKPERGGCEQENELETFHDPVFCWEGRIVREPGWKENGDRSQDNEKSREERLFPWLLGGLIHVGLESADGPTGSKDIVAGDNQRDELSGIDFLRAR
mgnify:CR=1 FL=1